MPRQLIMSKIIISMTKYGYDLSFIRNRWHFQKKWLSKHCPNYTSRL